MDVYSLVAKSNRDLHSFFFCWTDIEQVLKLADDSTLEPAPDPPDPAEDPASDLVPTTGVMDFSYLRMVLVFIVLL